MATYEQGQQVRLTGTFKDVNGTATDPTAVTFKYSVNNGVVTTLVYGTDAALVKSATGVYYVDLNLTTAGTYRYGFKGAGVIDVVGEGTLVAEATELDW